MSEPSNSSTVDKTTENNISENFISEPIIENPGFTEIFINPDRAGVFLVEPGTWVWILQKAAPYLAEFALSAILAAVTRPAGVKLHTESLEKISNIVRSRINEAFAAEYAADLKYVIGRLHLYDSTNELEYVKLAENRSSLLIPRFDSLGDQYLGGLWCALTFNLCALLALEEKTGDAGYRTEARRIVGEYGFNGVMGHGTNRLLRSLKMRSNTVTSCSCYTVGGRRRPERTICKYTDANGRVHKNLGSTDCNRASDNAKDEADTELLQRTEDTINPWKNAMATWERI